MYGPGTNLAHGGSLIFQSECQLNYALDGIRQVLAGRAPDRSRSTRPTADEYHGRYRSEIRQMVWSHPSVKYSHFKNADGEIFTLSPWPIPTYWTWTRRVDPDDYTFA